MAFMEANSRSATFPAGGGNIMFTQQGILLAEHELAAKCNYAKFFTTTKMQRIKLIKYIFHCQKLKLN